MMLMVALKAKCGCLSLMFDYQIVLPPESHTDRQTNGRLTKFSLVVLLSEDDIKANKPNRIACQILSVN